MLVYTYFGGLRATFFASYIHTVIIFTVLVVFILTYVHFGTPTLFRPFLAHFSPFFPHFFAVLHLAAKIQETGTKTLEKRSVTVENGGQNPPS